MRCVIPEDHYIVGEYARNHNYVYIKKKGIKEQVAKAFSLSDPTFNELPSQLIMFEGGE